MGERKKERAKERTNTFGIVPPASCCYDDDDDDNHNDDVQLRMMALFCRLALPLNPSPACVCVREYGLKQIILTQQSVIWTTNLNLRMIFFGRAFDIKHSNIPFLSLLI